VNEPRSPQHMLPKILTISRTKRKGCAKYLRLIHQLNVAVQFTRSTAVCISLLRPLFDSLKIKLTTQAVENVCS